MESFNPFSRFDPDEFETFSIESTFNQFDSKIGVPIQDQFHNEKENVLEHARQVHSESDDCFIFDFEPLTDFEKQAVFDRLNKLQFDVCNCMYTERLIVRKELFALTMLVLAHTGADAILKQLAQDAANLCIQSASQDLDIEFLHVSIIDIIRLQKPLKFFKHPLRAACEYQEKVYQTLEENFRKRTSYEHLLGHKSKASRLEDDVMFLKQECRKSLTDAMFRIRFQTVLGLHHRNQNRSKKRPPQTKSTRAAARELAFRYQDQTLTCFPEDFVDPPLPPKSQPWAGFWMQVQLYHPSKIL